MKKTTLITLVAALSANVSHGAMIIGFDEKGLAPESFVNHAGGLDGFTFRGVHFSNSFDSDFDFWGGFAFSSITDNQTRGWTNQYSAITGGDHSGSGTFGVAYTGGIDTVITLPEGYRFGSAWLTNTTYAYFSMLEGDDFAKKFGGESGGDPDWFRLDVRGYDDFNQFTGEFHLYLADFRGEENFILTTWEKYDFSVLGEARRAVFSLSSSDEGIWGMNTPAYFAIDSLEVVPEPSTAALIVGAAALGLAGWRRRRPVC